MKKYQFFVITLFFLLNLSHILMKKIVRKNEQGKSPQSKRPPSIVKTIHYFMKNILNNRLKMAFEQIKCASIFQSQESKLELLNEKSSFSEMDLLIDSRQQSKVSIFDGNLQYTKQEVLNPVRQNQELKRMFLSTQVRQALSKMQIFDKNTYNIQVQKVLQGHISNQIRRLQKIKSQFQENSLKLYDNQLTIICLSNHVKMIIEMNKQLQQMNMMKSYIGDLQKHMSEITINQREEIAEQKKKILSLEMSQVDNKKIKSSPTIGQDRNNSKITKQKTAQTPYARLKQNKSSVDDSNEKQASQLQDFKQFYQIVKEKMGQNTSYEEQLSQLKNAYPSSPLIELLQQKINSQNTQKLILENLQQVLMLFSQNGLRNSKKISKQQGQIFVCINKISSSINVLLKENQMLSKSQNELDSIRKKCKILSEENQEMRLSLKEFQMQLSKKHSNYKKIGENRNNKYKYSKVIQKTKKNDIQELNKQNQQIIQLSIEIAELHQQLQMDNIELEKQQQFNLQYNKVLFKKIKSQRDNLKLLLQQKNEQYEISKQNEEKFQQLKKKDDQAINQLKKKIKKIDEQNKKLSNQLKQAEKDNKINKRIEQEVQKNQFLLQQNKNSQQTFQKQRQIFRQKLIQFNRLSKEESATLESEKRQKLQLQLRIQQLTFQMSIQLRNSQNQKRQTRKYVQQLLNEIKIKDLSFNQQKILLKEDIQRARCEQYQINQVKINKLRQETQAIRLQNERLMQIIENNQAPFNQLLTQHQILCEQINRLLIEIKQLTTIIKQLQIEVEQMKKEIKQIQQQKANLYFQLTQLRDQISNYEKKIQIQHYDNKSKSQINQSNQLIMRKLQEYVQQLQNLNDELSFKNLQHLRQVMELNSRLVNYEIQIKTQKQSFSKTQQALESRQGEYQRYLQEKNRQYEEQLNNCRKIQRQFIVKLEKSQQQTNKLRSQKERTMYLMNQKDVQLIAEKQKSQKDIMSLIIQINKSQQKIVTKNDQIKRLKQDSSHLINVNQILQTLKNKQLFMQNLSEQNNKLRLLIQQSNKQLVQFKKVIEQNKRIVLQNKRLNNKLSLASEQFEQIRQKYIQSQQKIIHLQCRIKEISSNSIQLLSNQYINFNQKLEKQEQNIYQQQLKQKDNQILQIRRLNFGLLTKFNEIQRKLVGYEVKQEQYNRNMMNYEQVKLKLRNTQGQLIRLESQKKFDSQKWNRQIEQKQQTIKNLKNQILSLTQRQNKLITQHSLFRQSQKQLLLQIIRKFDENYKLYQEQQHIKDLDRISKQVSQLIENNKKLNQRCEESSRLEYQIQIQQIQADIFGMLGHVIDDFIGYLTIKNYLNPQEISIISRQTNIQIFIEQLGPFLKSLFESYSKNTQSQIQKYNKVIRDIGILIQQAQVSYNFDALNNLLRLLKQAD